MISRPREKKLCLIRPRLQQTLGSAVFQELNGPLVEPLVSGTDAKLSRIIPTNPHTRVGAFNGERNVFDRPLTRVYIKRINARSSSTLIKRKRKRAFVRQMGNRTSECSINCHTQISIYMLEMKEHRGLSFAIFSEHPRHFSVDFLL